MLRAKQLDFENSSALSKKAFSGRGRAGHFGTLITLQWQLELELIQTQMAQKPKLRAEVGMRVRCANKASAEFFRRERGIGQIPRKICKKRGICGCCALRRTIKRKSSCFAFYFFLLAVSLLIPVPRGLSRNSAVSSNFRLPRIE